MNDKERRSYTIGVKIPPGKVLRQEIFWLIGDELEAVGHPLDTFVNLAARPMLQVGMEREVESASGRTPKILRELSKLREKIQPLRAVA